MLVNQERKFEDYPLTLDERFFKELLFLRTENQIKGLSLHFLHSFFISLNKESSLNEILNL